MYVHYEAIRLYELSTNQYLIKHVTRIRQVTFINVNLLTKVLFIPNRNLWVSPDFDIDDLIKSSHRSLDRFVFTALGVSRVLWLTSFCPWYRSC